MPPLSALVARPVNKAELKASEDATKAMKKSWDKLVEKGTFDLEVIRPAAEVRLEANQMGFKAHFGRVFGICVEKGAELDKSDENRYYKGRYVFQGSDVRDEWGGGGSKLSSTSSLLTRLELRPRRLLTSLVFSLVTTLVRRMLSNPTSNHVFVSTRPTRATARARITVKANLSIL